MSNPAPTCPASRSKVVDLYFLEHRAKVIDIAAFLDRADRAEDEGEAACAISTRTFTWSRARRTTISAWRMAGCVAITEPAFWAGFDRSPRPQGFYDYFRLLTEYEPKRAANTASSTSAGSASTQGGGGCRFRPRGHELIPEFLDKPNVLGIGEIGLNKNSRNELTIFEEQIAARGRARPADPDPHAAP
jgi:hypothetical protein